MNKRTVILIVVLILCLVAAGFFYKDLILEYTGFSSNSKIKSKKNVVSIKTKRKKPDQVLETKKQQDKKSSTQSKIDENLKFLQELNINFISNLSENIGIKLQTDYNFMGIKQEISTNLMKNIVEAVSDKTGLSSYQRMIFEKGDNNIEFVQLLKNSQLTMYLPQDKIFTKKDFSYPEIKIEQISKDNKEYYSIDIKLNKSNYNMPNNFNVNFTGNINILADKKDKLYREILLDMNFLKIKIEFNYDEDNYLRKINLDMSFTNLVTKETKKNIYEINFFYNEDYLIEKIKFLDNSAEKSYEIKLEYSDLVLKKIIFPQEIKEENNFVKKLKGLNIDINTDENDYFKSVLINSENFKYKYTIEKYYKEKPEKLEQLVFAAGSKELPADKFFSLYMEKFKSLASGSGNETAGNKIGEADGAEQKKEEISSTPEEEENIDEIPPELEEEMTDEDIEAAPEPMEPVKKQKTEEPAILRQNIAKEEPEKKVNKPKKVSKKKNTKTAQEGLKQLTPPGEYIKALSLYKKGNPSRALNILNDYLKNNSDEPYTNFLLGYIYFNNNEHLKAKQYLKKAHNQREDLQVREWSRHLLYKIKK